MNPGKTRILLLMGVSSSGKTTIGERLSTQLGWPFFDGDDFHPAANVEKMRVGIPLEDSDRMPWLAAIRGQIDQQIKVNKPAIFACSALRESYRQILIGGVAGVRLIHLNGPIELMRERANARVHQYMPASLVDSQFAVLELPPEGITISVAGSIEKSVAEILDQL